MGRWKQLFIAPGPDDDALPITASPWHVGRLVALPMEHWEVILAFAAEVDESDAEMLRELSYRPREEPLPLEEELEDAIGFLRELQHHIKKAPPLVPEVTEEIPENFENQEHVRMIDAVVAVLEEAKRKQLPFEAAADS